MGAKKIICNPIKLLEYLFGCKTVDYGEYVHTQDHICLFITGFDCKNAVSHPIHYHPPKAAFDNTETLLPQGDFIGLCPVSKAFEKDIPLFDCKELIQRLNEEGKKVVLTGAGERCAEYAEDLRTSGCEDFVDLVNKTSISELAAVIKTVKST